VSDTPFRIYVKHREGPQGAYSAPRVIMILTALRNGALRPNKYPQLTFINVRVRGHRRSLGEELVNQSCSVHWANTSANKTSGEPLAARANGGDSELIDQAQYLKCATLDFA